MSNVDCGLNFVTCENPHLDASLPDVKDGLTDILLQLVLDGCGAEKLKVSLD